MYRRDTALTRPTELKFLSPLILALGLMVAASASAAPCGGNDQARCDFGNAQYFSEVDFADEVADAFDGLKGWSLTLVDRDGNQIVRASQGFANSTTGQPFYSTTVSGIGSISKMLTEAAVRHAIELNQELPNVACADTYSLDTLFLEALPSIFSELAHESYADVTIEQILQHRGGVPHTVNDNPGVPHWNRRYEYYNTMKKIEVTKICTKDDSCYSNDNYVLATMMLPIIHNCGYKAIVEDWGDALCANVSGARERAECKIQIAFDLLGRISNEIVSEAVLKFDEA
jgi:CubicO group peptidase (beta-lactamase class C family)